VEGVNAFKLLNLLKVFKMLEGNVGDQPPTPDSRLPTDG
jgi:hypothetical protein